MTQPYRHNFKWNVNELLSLQREYELLEWTIQEIAYKHQRSVRAILCKLEAEGFIGSWDNARGFNSKEYQDICDGAIDEEESEVEFDSYNKVEIKEVKNVRSKPLIEVKIKEEKKQIVESPKSQVFEESLTREKFLESVNSEIRRIKQDGKLNKEEKKKLIKNLLSSGL